MKAVPRERVIAPRKNSIKRRPQQEGEQDAGEAFFQELPRRIPNGQQEGAGNHEKQGDGDPHQHRIKEDQAKVSLSGVKGGDTKNCPTMWLAITRIQAKTRILSSQGMREEGRFMKRFLNYLRTAPFLSP